jgi:hypothetical protein
MNLPDNRSNRRSDIAAILAGGIVAGTVDVGAASLIYLISPVVILRAIAAGVLGPASFGKGWESAVLGLGLQLAMSNVMAALYVLAVHWIPFFRRAWISGGLVAGIVIFVVMNYVVVPMSAIGKAPKFTAWTFSENLLAMILFGIIIAFFARQEKSPTPH